jgi:hypothetical protein
MSARLMLATVGAALVAATAQAQTTTADGVAALARGDTGRAAEILRPIAEDWTRVDVHAAFFLGTLYETGRGVPLDPLRACALYQRATADQGGLFQEIASMLLKKLLFAHEEPWRNDCAVMTMVGMNSRFEPASFSLDSEQSVEWTIGGATVTYKQNRRFFPVRGAERGAIFLPLHRIDLRVPAAGPVPRHFVELFFWQPLENTWTLRWFLYEISNGELRTAAVELALAQSDGRQPPDVTRFDPGAFVNLRMNDSGMAEATLRMAAGPRTIVLPPRPGPVR